MVLKRFVDGAEGEPFFQKRAPAQRPEWIETARITFPSGRHADLAVCDEPADVIWAVNLGCLDLNPWPVRADDVDHPDELRVDLDPTPGIAFAHVREVALMVRDVLRELGMDGFPKTSGSRGIHINVRIEPKWRVHATCAAARSRSDAKSSAACPRSRRRSGGRRSATASSSTTTRTRATAPSHRRTRSGRRRTRACRAR